MTTERDDDGADRDRTRWLDAIPGSGFELPGTGVLEDLGAELRRGIEGMTPSADGIEAILDGVSIPDVGDIDVDAVVRPGETIDDEQVDGVVETGEHAVEIAVEHGEDAATVLVDTGGEVIEIGVENGGEAAEATAELLAAALDGL
ncbi:hypothetical protein ACFR9U_07095 [Halorientalis brevis]|uniref:Uncharacterized protein n=1 Tax=Halorientalis brevis TaxID=1126241 RepID=A0ABD6C9K9_9EURY|nr:hypothetical protein [Halorientalis brevis]